MNRKTGLAILSGENKGSEAAEIIIIGLTKVPQPSRQTMRHEDPKFASRDPKRTRYTKPDVATLPAYGWNKLGERSRHHLVVMQDLLPFISK